jgi:transposase
MKSTDTEPIRPQNRSLHVEQRLQALSLTEHEIATKIVQTITEVSVRSISDLKKKARQRGYDPLVSRVLIIEYVIDDHRSGRPPKVTPAVEQAILNNVRQDRNDREKCSARLRYEHEVSSTTILRVLKRNGFRPCKSTMKPGLDAAMMKARLQFCLRYKN